MTEKRVAQDGGPGSTWLVTGGAGYIGAHVVRAFQAAGMDCVVVDDLSTGHAEFVPSDVPFLRGDICETAALAAFMRSHNVGGVVHVAGFKFAGVSVERPLITYRANVQGVVSVLEAMEAVGARLMVFSSSAATYGSPTTPLVTEDTETHPESPYGESKLIGEWLMADQARATGLRHTSLRYFNVVGSGHPDIYDSSAHNLFPLVLKALADGATPVIFGDDYPTEDGTCVRDYVHVQDIAQAHVVAARALRDGVRLHPVYNLGSGDGTSVRQIMDAMSRVTGTPFVPEVRARRPGDPARIVADGTRAARDLDWRMRYSLDEMVRSAVRVADHSR
ncbi:UDP-glucose 4-epimerase GalE [Micrococcus luteus]|jgi:UDP-glucose 4-epimerase|uniref:UDP-glucose 4-epimerase n=2 Tax=Bacteria TaxID=2 RepID=C5C9F8_MICLC|nr:UDP-glucose 4-epimerase GalE [Micrococcus luteus]ACS30110.1 UDP-galactose 4-epimerase [Micrococcus luteus NCTC 2665]AJO55231.1 UDP-glucose 4-epimerase [Micrococcus luteus]KAB1903276.1 UDP-glucose 4-epimerase GalE [Micrococcus luteus NCTC 2665]ORE62982.1 UDP-glucose 4-epimerase GalE [Micrococcus luteus]QCY43956.1 UDP-glucose 4-epimerase GalE [Micrococcus luteus]